MKMKIKKKKKKKMKIILLEHPRERVPERCNDIANTPLSSCLLSGYVAALLLKEGHEVEIIEGYLENLTYEDIKNRIRAFAPDILGAHMVYHWGKDRALAGFLSEVKKECQPRFIAAYGYYPTFAFRDILTLFPAVDGVLTGEPELTFKSLAQALASGQSAGKIKDKNENKNKKIAGLVTAGDSWDLGGGQFSIPRIAEDLDTLPFPLRTPAMRRLPEVNLLGSRGCYGQCTFCHLSSFGGRWRGRSPENIAEEIDRIISESGARDFYFTDPNFFGPGAAGQERALRLASLIGPKNIRFGIEARANDIRDETIGALAKAGLRQILIGLESGRDEALKRMGKMTTVSEGEEAIRILRRYGIEPNIGFIMFEPASTLEDIRANFEFLKRNSLLENLAVTANVLSHHQILLKGTKAYGTPGNDGQKNAYEAVPYEVEASFNSPEVGELAFIMRRAANLLFVRMDGIWSGRLLAPPGAQERYREINRFLVELFESTLSRLSLTRGGRFNPEQPGPEKPGSEKMEMLAAQAEKEILNLLPTGYFLSGTSFKTEEKPT